MNCCSAAPTDDEKPEKQQRVGKRKVASRRNVFRDTNTETHEVHVDELCSACYYGELEVVKRLVAKGEDPHRVRAAWTAPTGGYWCGASQHHRFASIAVHKAQNLSMHWVSHSEPCIIAVLGGTCVVRDPCGCVCGFHRVSVAPLWIAAFRGRLSVVKYLVEMANVDIIQVRPANMVSLVFLLTARRILPFLLHKVLRPLCGTGWLL